MYQYGFINCNKHTTLMHDSNNRRKLGRGSGEERNGNCLCSCFLKIQNYSKKTPFNKRKILGPLSGQQIVACNKSGARMCAGRWETQLKREVRLDREGSQRQHQGMCALFWRQQRPLQRSDL